MKVLYIGATGEVGRRTLLLLRTKYEVVGAALGGGEVDGVPVHSLDITDYEATLGLITQVKPDIVVNSAIANYRTRTRDAPPDLQHDYHCSAIDVNVRGTYHIYEACRAAGVPKVVYISSLTVVSGLPRLESISGDDPPHPSDLYACTKLFGEQLGQVYVQRHGLNVTSLRLGQPCPMRPAFEPIWFRDPLSQGKMVHFEDIAVAILGSLKPSTGLKTYTVLSDSDYPWLRVTSIPDLDYVPAYHFTAEGIRRKA